MKAGNHTSGWDDRYSMKRLATHSHSFLLSQVVSFFSPYGFERKTIITFSRSQYLSPNITHHQRWVKIGFEQVKAIEAIFYWETRSKFISDMSMSSRFIQSTTFFVETVYCMFFLNTFKWNV